MKQQKAIFLDNTSDITSNKTNESMFFQTSNNTDLIFVDYNNTPILSIGCYVNDTFNQNCLSFIHRGTINCSYYEHLNSNYSFFNSDTYMVIPCVIKELSENNPKAKAILEKYNITLNGSGFK